MAFLQPGKLQGSPLVQDMLLDTQHLVELQDRSLLLLEGILQEEQERSTDPLVDRQTPVPLAETEMGCLRMASDPIHIQSRASFSVKSRKALSSFRYLQGAVNMQPLRAPISVFDSSLSEKCFPQITNTTAALSLCTSDISLAQMSLSFLPM